MRSDDKKIRVSGWAFVFILATVVSLSGSTLAKPEAAQDQPPASGNSKAGESERPNDAALAGSSESAGATDSLASVSAGSGDPSASLAAKSGVNRFNRLLKSPSDWNLPPTRDGIHDPTGVGTPMLQKPKEAFAPLPKSNSGNRIDWVAALNEGLISPRFDKVNPERQAAVFDFNVVREVKGTMPNVVYPHKQHTQWLDCTNCHPTIFIPKKGANQISMASILMGKQCGVCHGKVAFPVSECRKCHSGEKSLSKSK